MSRTKVLEAAISQSLISPRISGLGRLDMFLRMSSSEMVGPGHTAAAVTVSTELLRQRLQREGVSEAAIADSEKIVRAEFEALHKKLVLKQKQALLVDTLRQLEVETISLDEAARVLLREGHAESNMRTKVRRFYDIANVLSSLNLFEKTEQADTRKPTFRWLGQAKRKQENNASVALPQAGKAVPNKTAFGTDLTNIDNKRGKLDLAMESKVKLVQGGGNIVKAFERQLEQGNRSDFVYGPFHPVARKQEIDDHTVREKERKTIQDWENLSVSFRRQYQNQALNDLFGHYVEAWKSWHLGLTRETASQNRI